MEGCCGMVDRILILLGSLLLTKKRVSKILKLFTVTVKMEYIQFDTQDNLDRQGREVLGKILSLLSSGYCVLDVRRDVLISPGDNLIPPTVVWSIDFIDKRFMIRIND